MTDAMLILGAGAPLWDDLECLEAMIGGPWPGLVMVVNNVGSGPDKKGRCYEGPVDHWVSLHSEAEKFKVWIEQRDKNGLEPAGCTWAFGGESHPKPWVDRWATKKGRNLKGGSSSLLAVSVAIHDLHVPKSVLCGVPMDDQINLWTGRHWGSYERYRLSWTNNAELLRAHVRCLSLDAGGSDSFTRELLGPPAAEWLNGVPEKDCGCRDKRERVRIPRAEPLPIESRTRTRYDRDTKEWRPYVSDGNGGWTWAA